MSIKKQPIYLNLFRIRFPVTAICSILHRITGILIFLATPFVLWVLHSSLKSPEHFQNVVTCLNHPAMKFGVWVFLSVLIYHIVAGVRHIVMDMGIAENIETAKQTALATIVLSALLAIALGVCLW